MLRSNVQTRAASGSKPSTSPSHGIRPSLKVVCHSTEPSAAAAGAGTARRDVLLAGIAAPLIITQSANAASKQTFLEVTNLSSFQKNDQRNDFIARSQIALREVLTADDAPAVVRLALYDAGTYDVVTKTGGFDGSIATNSEELSRPENAGLKALVDRLKVAKAKIDERDTVGSGPISWADLIYLAGKVTLQDSWARVKVGQGSGSKMIATAYRNPWPVEIGRVDGTGPGPNRLPPMDADVETIRAALLKLGAKPGAGSGPFTPKAPFWEKPGFILWTAMYEDSEAEEQRFVAANPDVYAGIKREADISRRTVTRTDYEVDFATFFNKLTGTTCGAKFNPLAYLHREQTTFIF